MSPTRITLLGVASALVASWLTAATMTHQVETISRRVVLPHQMLAPSDDAVGLATEVQRLRSRLDNAPAPWQADRNPFELDVEEVEPHPAGEPRSESRPPKASTFLEVSLVGIAEESTLNGPVRTAIVSVAGEVILVGEGGAVGTRFIVDRIGSVDLQLRDLEDGTFRTLVLP